MANVYVYSVVAIAADVLPNRPCRCTIVTALHGKQMRSSNENFVCLSVKCMHCDKTEEKSVQIFTTCERSFSLVIREEEWLVGGAPSTRNLGQSAPVRAKSAILNQ